MKITLIADIYGETNNGTSITAARLVAGLRERGHSVTVVSPSAGEGDGYVQLPRRHIPIFQNYVEKLNGVAMAAVDEAVLRRWIAESDVVHFLLPFQVSQAGVRIARELGIPYTTAFHCQPENITSHLFLMNLPAANRLIYARFRRRFYRYTRFIHCPSRFIADQLIENGYDADCRVISNGVVPVFRPHEAARPPEDEGLFRILFTGRYAKEKRHDLLIRAAGLSRHADRIRLIFAGNGPQQAHLEKLAATLPHPPRFGLFTPEQLSDVINSCDLYVHPSDVEIEAISCIEAFSCGLVPVISDSPKSATNQFALDDRHLFRAGDPHSLAAQIDYWIEHPDEKAAASRAYIDYGRRFAIDACIDQMEEMFRDAIAYYGGGGS